MSSDQELEYVRHALTLGLPEVDHVKAYQGGKRNALHIAAGGPSLADTMHLLDLPHTMAANGSLNHLLRHGMVPGACVICDPLEGIARGLAVHPDVNYYVASRCHPILFERLKGCKVALWHAPGTDMRITYPSSQTKMFLTKGGTVSLRAWGLGYVMGYRDFHFHGMDSSYRGTREAPKTHVYPDVLDTIGEKAIQFTIKGYPTGLVFAEQVLQFIAMYAELMDPAIANPFEPCTVTVHGDGLLQTCFREYVEQKKAA
jgi:hypothetical protein